MTRKMKTSLVIILLICMSAAVYLIQFLLFGRPAETAFYFLEDLAFVPISVILVTLGVNTIMNRRDRQAMLEKVSIVVNEFYSEAGTEMITSLRGYLVNLDELSEKLQLSGHWQDKDFQSARAFLCDYPIAVDIRSNNLYELLSLLENKKDQLLRLFENANLMEHDSFTDMLWAVYHLYDELRSRESLDDLGAADIKHLNIDIQRAVRLLLIEWIDSMRALKVRYPYLYSLAVRKCPFGKTKINVES